MKVRLLISIILVVATQTAFPEKLLSLDSCITLSLANNKQMAINATKRDMARNIRKSARAKYLPQFNAYGAYLYSSKEISLLSGAQKAALNNIGTSLSTAIGAQIQSYTSQLSDAQAMALAGKLSDLGISLEQLSSGFDNSLEGMAQSLDAQGQAITDAFSTNTHNVYAASITAIQPIYMGGSITAVNKMADIGEEMAINSYETTRQNTLYDTQKTYWMVVSLKHKARLADSYLSLVKQLSQDVEKMVREGIATKQELLSVEVKVNEAEMTLTQVDNALSLARMSLCILCGLPVDSQPILEDEDTEDLAFDPYVEEDFMADVAETRPELRLLQNVTDLSRQTTKLLKAGNLPKLALFGAYTLTNPNVYDGFQRKFAGAWNVGVVLAIPIWNWGDVAYKVKASKNATTIATLTFDEKREMIELQITQCSLKNKEAYKRYEDAKHNIAHAEENLRCATLGFKEGVMATTTVMEAQTAWLQAQSQKIDAQINLKLTQIEMKKAFGILQ